MTWQTNKPDSPGVWWYCDGINSTVYQYHAWLPVEPRELFIASVTPPDGRTEYVRAFPATNAPEGYWLKQDTPPAFIAPKPPKVEWDEVWEAQYKYSDGKPPRWIYKKGERFVATNLEGIPQATGHVRELCNYTLIRKVPQC